MNRPAAIALFLTTATLLLAAAGILCAAEKAPARKKPLLTSQPVKPAAPTRPAAPAASRPMPAVPKAPATTAAGWPVPQPRKSLREITHLKRAYVDLLDLGVRYGFKSSTKKSGKDFVLTLTTPRKETLVFTERLAFCQIAGIQASLSFPVIVNHGRFYLEKTDFTELLEPLLQTAKLPRRTIQHIVVDPGHGGKDQGAARGKFLEKDLNLLMARKVASILRKRGYKVSMTRNGDTTLTLDQRCSFAEAKKADLFLSIHTNAMESTDGHGIEVYVANPPGVPSVGTTNIGKQGKATPFQRTSALWGFFTQRALIKATGAFDRGLRRKQFKVIIDTPAPAMLVEIGYLSNEKERAKLQRADYQDSLAVAICDGVDQLRNAVKPQKGK